MVVRFVVCVATAACVLTATTAAAPTYPQRPRVVSTQPSWFPDSRRLAFVSNLARPKLGDRVAYDDPAFDVFSVGVDGSGLRNLTADSPDVADIYPSVSPDGMHIAFLRRTSTGFDLVRMAADGTNKRVLASDAASYPPEWSPDGREIAFVRCCDGIRHRIEVIDRDGVSRRVIADGGARVAWSPDGSRLAFVGSLVGNPAILVVDKDGGLPRSLGQGVAGGTLAWSPDSSRIAFAVAGRLGSSAGIAVASLEGGERRLLVEGFGSQPDWSPSGRHVAFSHYVLETVDVETRELRFVAAGPLGSPQWSPDGERIAYAVAEGSQTSSSPGSYLEVVRPDGRERTRITPEAPPATPQPVVPVTSVAPPNRLLITSISVSPRTVRRGGVVVARVWVEARRSLVDGAEVSVSATRGAVIRTQPEAPRTRDGSVAIRIRFVSVPRGRRFVTLSFVAASPDGSVTSYREVAAVRILG